MSIVLDCRQSLSEFSLCFSSTRLRGHRLGYIALFTALFDVPLSPTDIRRHFTYNCEMILDSQGDEIFTVFSIYTCTSLQAGHYHVKKTTHFNTAAVWLELRPTGEFVSRYHTVL